MVRVLGQSQFQDWENHYFVDRKLLASSVQWILQQQNLDGTFVEPKGYCFPLENRPVGNMTRKVGLTAHVLIGLSKCSDSLEGILKVATANAKSLSVR